jgi:hypothetical protein
MNRSKLMHDSSFQSSSLAPGHATWPDGKYRDRLLRADGSVRDFGVRSNIVVDRCRQLLSAFMRGDSAASGIQSLALGRGDPAWDTQAVPPLASTEQLVDGAPVVIAVASSDISYLDASGTPVAGPTPRLQITVTLAPGTPPPPLGETSYPLREFALFGAIGGDEYMIDCVRHPVIHKGAADTLVRTIRLVF